MSCNTVLGIKLVLGNYPMDNNKVVKPLGGKNKMGGLMNGKLHKNIGISNINLLHVISSLKFYSYKSPFFYNFTFQNRKNEANINQKC